MNRHRSFHETKEPPRTRFNLLVERASKQSCSLTRSAKKGFDLESHLSHTEETFPNLDAVEKALTERPEFQRDHRYYALHDVGLRNGSFIRTSALGGSIAQFMNGDYMGLLDELPTTYANQPLVEYPREVAERMIPRCCR